MANVGALLFHPLQDFLDPRSFRFRQTSHLVRFLPPRLDLHAVPEPSRMIMIPCYLLPRDFLIRPAQPEKAMSLNQNLFRRQVDLLRN